MTENHQPFVSPDRLSRPEQTDLGYQAAVRALVIGNAVGFAAQSLSPMLTNVLVAEATKYPVESYQQPTYEQPAQPAQYQASAAPGLQQSQYHGEGAAMDLYAQPSATENNMYLNALVDAEPISTPGVAPESGWQQPVMNTDASARAEEARRMAAEARGGQSNYDLAA
jgi:hypothetical protein